MIDHNPVGETETIKATTDGYHTWTEAEIDQFVSRHPLGTKPYLALMLMLWTFQRRSDAVAMARGHVIGGSIRVKMQKAGKGRAALEIPLAPPLVEAIAAMPVPPVITDETTFLLTEFGHPFSAKGFGNWFRRRCNEAGLPQCSAHGLRKAASRRAAELGLSNQSIKSVTGHRNDSEVALYTAAAEQRAMARDAIDRLAAWHLSNRAAELDNEA
jgi:integrase